MSAIVIKQGEEKYSVPCGRCPQCVARRVSAWSFRLMQEDKKSITSYFITLTYDSKNIPISRAGFKDLSKRDVQLFFKRLRKIHDDDPGKKTAISSDASFGSKKGASSVGDRSIKYYAVGEYGGKTMRPHYHIILFNAKLELIQPAWDKGHVHYGYVTGASVGYTMKYISKPGKIPLHRNDDRQPEFALMSKGLGKDYLTPQICQWHKKDLLNRMYLNIEGGKKCSMPRYYKDRIYSLQERSEIAGYQKGEIEKKTLKEVSEAYDAGKNYARDKKEAVKAAYKKMYHDYSKVKNKGL